MIQTYNPDTVGLQTWITILQPYVCLYTDGKKPTLLAAEVNSYKIGVRIFSLENSTLECWCYDFAELRY